MINRMTIKKASELTGLSTSWFRKHIKLGHIPFYKAMGDSRILISMRDIEKFTPKANDILDFDFDSFLE